MGSKQSRESKQSGEQIEEGEKETCYAFDMGTGKDSELTTEQVVVTTPSPPEPEVSAQDLPKVAEVSEMAETKHDQTTSLETEVQKPDNPSASHNKFVKWLVEKAGEDRIDLSDPAIVQQIQTSVIGEKMLKENDRYPCLRSVSCDSQQGSQFKSTRSCCDIEEENSSHTEDGEKQALKSSLQPTCRTTRYTKLTKQHSTPYSTFVKAGSESPVPSNYQRSSKSYSDLNDSVNFFKNQEQNLLLSHKRRGKQRQRNKFMKQYSESQAENYSGYTIAESYRSNKSSSQSSDSIVETRLTIRNPMCSRQTTFSDDEEGMSSDKSVSPATHPPMDVLQLLENTETDDFSKGGKKNRRRNRNPFGDIISRSVGNLIDKSSRLKHTMRRKSSSLFTINKNNNNYGTKPQEEQDPDPTDPNAPPMFLDDKLLDANMADILCAVDALWPGMDKTQASVLK